MVRPQLFLRSANKYLTKICAVLSLLEIPNYVDMQKITNIFTDARKRLVNSRRFLLLTHQYAKLLQRGELEFLVKNGKFKFVIKHPELIPAKAPLSNPDAYAPYVCHVSELMMHLYLKLNPRRFEFFLIHPLGLKVLAKEGFSGVIANHEKEFVELGKNFPESFRVSPDAQREFIDLLNIQLEVSLPYPNEDAAKPADK